MQNTSGRIVRFRTLGCRALCLGVAICTIGCRAPVRNWDDWVVRAREDHLITPIAATSPDAAPSPDTAPSPGIATSPRVILPVATPSPLPTTPSTSTVPTPTDRALFKPALGYQVGQGAQVSDGHDLSMRNPDFPRTHIALIDIDLTDPSRSLRLTWTGPLAPQGPTGPFCSTSGKGAPDCDCNDRATSNRVDTLCTPKGVFPVMAFSDHLVLAPYCDYATWVIHAPRFIAIHSHFNVPRQPSSSGCIRADLPVAKLIHNNSLVGETLVNIHGEWKRDQTTERE